MSELIEKYGTTGTLNINGLTLPIVNIPMMSDEQWEQLAREQALKNYRLINGREPGSIEEAVQWQRERSKARAKAV